MKKIKVRPMTFAEVAELNENSEFHVPHSDREGGVLVEAKLHGKLAPREQDVLRQGVPTGRSIPSVSITTKYGVWYSVLASEIYVEDPSGLPVQVMEETGTQVSVTFYAPAMEGPDVLERVHEALRGEFGPGVLQLRTQNHRPVSEAGLPPVLGVPNGAMPNPI